MRKVFVIVLALTFTNSAFANSFGTSCPSCGTAQEFALFGAGEAWLTFGGWATGLNTVTINGKNGMSAEVTAEMELAGRGILTIMDISGTVWDAEGNVVSRINQTQAFWDVFTAWRVIGIANSTYGTPSGSNSGSGTGGGGSNGSPLYSGPGYNIGGMEGGACAFNWYNGGSSITCNIRY